MWLWLSECIKSIEINLRKLHWYWLAILWLPFLWTRIGGWVTKVYCMGESSRHGCNCTPKWWFSKVRYFASFLWRLSGALSTSQASWCCDPSASGQKTTEAEIAVEVSKDHGVKVLNHQVILKLFVDGGIMSWRSVESWVALGVA